LSGLITPDGLQVTLDALVSGTVYLGLAHSIPTTSPTNNVTLANMNEVTTDGYARVAITWDPATTSDLEEEPYAVPNSAIVDLPALTVDLPSPANFAFLTNSLTGNVISPPVATLGVASSGGAFVAGDYKWVVTATNKYGETLASNELTATLTLNQQQPVNWAAVTGATGYNIYRTNVATGTVLLVASVGAVTTYTDPGNVGNPGGAPGASTAASGKVLYVWTLTNPVTGLSGQQIRVAKGGLVIN